MSAEMYDIFNSQRDEYETRGLYELISYLNYYFDTSTATMVELGSYAGQSTSIFSKYFKKVVAIDPWENHDEYPHDMNLVEKVFDKFVGSQRNVEKRKGYSVEVSETFKDNSLDFVYIDARHEEEYVLEDIEVWLPKLKKHGFIGGHDFYLYPVTDPWVGKAVLSKYDKDDILLFTDGSWLVKCNTTYTFKDEILYIPPLQLEDEYIHEGSFPPMNHYCANISENDKKIWIESAKKRGFDKL